MALKRTRCHGYSKYQGRAEENLRWVVARIGDVSAPIVQYLQDSIDEDCYRRSRIRAVRARHACLLKPRLY